MAELKHHYGPQVHILNDHFLTTVLAHLCSPETFQPTINHLVELIYARLTNEIMNALMPLKNIQQATRMTTQHPDQLLNCQIIDPTQRVIIVNIARAGNYPSHVCFERLHYVLKPTQIRQDHIFAARAIDESHKVIGSTWSGMKIGGDIEKALVILPDPMGATGNTILSALDFYKNQVPGKAMKFIAAHLIVTPEYLKSITSHHPDVEVYSVRVDRGLSPKDVLSKEPGLEWDRERGLDENDYIVPGGGGFGEIMNNSFV